MNRPFIVAELSANHLGIRERAHALVAAAASAGADAIKLQCWTPDTMCISDYVIERGPWAGRKMADLYRDCYTPIAWFPELFADARRYGMAAFASTFDTAAVDFLALLRGHGNNDIIKVSSFELIDDRLLKHIAKSPFSRVFLSTGAATNDEIRHAVGLLNAKDVTLLHCVSEYPSKPEHASLANMVYLNDYIAPTGLSDHSVGCGVACAAAALGATVIEKHLTLRRADGGPDAGFSMEPAEFAAMVTAVRQAAVAVGEVKWVENPSPLRRGLWLARDVRAGDALTEGDLTTARPQTGLPANAYYAVLGMKAVRDLSARQPLRPGDVG